MVLRKREEIRLSWWVEQQMRDRFGSKRLAHIASEALEHGLERYERRHPRARGLVQGSVVVLKNRDGSVLAETGGRQVYRGRAASYRDFNRATGTTLQRRSATPRSP